MSFVMIRIRDLVMRLPSGGRSLTILDGITLDVSAGEVCAITGPSGSGKSTLLGLIAGLDRPSAGSIAVAGVEITGLDEDALAKFRRATVGYVFQSYHLIPTMTAVENAAVPFEIAGEPDALERARALLGDVGLADRAHHYPVQLSGGEQQRVALARAVALGVAALFSVGTFAANLDRTLAREARALTGGDLELRSTYPLAADALAALERLRGAGAVTTTVRELVGMARDPVRGGTLLVELKAVEPAYPLYGRLQTTPAVPLGGLLAARGGADGAVVESQLLERLGLAVGDAFVVGNARYTVSGVLVREPDRSVGLVTLGPRVLVADESLGRTGLLQVGSRVRTRTLVRLAAGAPVRPVVAELARAVGDPSVRIAAFDDTQPGLRRFFSQPATDLV